MACQLDAPFESLESFVQREIATLESLDQTFELGQCFLEIRGFSIAHQATAPAQTHSDIKGGHVTHRRREGSNQLGEFASGSPRSGQWLSWRLTCLRPKSTVAT